MGEMLLALKAASIGIVPPPHIGSIMLFSGFHPLILSMAEANVGFRAAGCSYTL